MLVHKCGKLPCSVDLRHLFRNLTDPVDQPLVFGSLLQEALYLTCRTLLSASPNYSKLAKKGRIKWSNHDFCLLSWKASIKQGIVTTCAGNVITRTADGFVHQSVGIDIQQFAEHIEKRRTASP